jgi:two-component system cell cycle response regulator CtrA
MRVLLVDDDPMVLKTTSISLANSGGIVCDCVSSGSRAYQNALKYDYDMILLDLSLPDINGYEILSKLRASRVKTPIMIISGNTAIDSKANCLDNGADDYIVKPYDYGELISRIKAIHRRFRGKANSVVKIGDLVINFDDRMVTIKDQRIELTPTEYSVLELLAIKKGTILSKRIFINHLYPNITKKQNMDKKRDKIVDVFICKLRNKLKSIGGREYISTMWGRGYTLQDEESNHNSVD